MGKKEEENFAYSLIINWWSINYPFLLRQGWYTLNQSFSLTAMLY
jgi:hypothetical protein